MNSVKRLVGRYLTAEQLGDPSVLVAKFTMAMDALETKHKPQVDNLPKAREALRVVLEYYQDYRKAHRNPRPDEYEFLEYWGKVKYDYALFPKFSLPRLQAAGVQTLFLALLQSFELPTAIRRKVEQAAKYYARTRALNPKMEDCLEVFEKTLNTYREHLALAKQAIAQGKPHQEGGTQIKAGSFTLVNAGGFSPEVMTEVVKVVEKAEKLMRAAGLGRVCYGEVMITKTVNRSNVLAFYVIAQDQLLVRANLKGKYDAAVRTVCHELAHRLQFRFLTNRFADIKSLYNVLARKENERTTFDLDLREALDDPSRAPKSGDRVVIKGQAWEVVDVEYGRGYRVKLKDPDDPAPKRGGTVSIGLRTYLQLKGQLPQVSSFITPYAKTDPDENFAEMVSFYVAGDLPPDQVAMLEPLLETGAVRVARRFLAKTTFVPEYQKATKTFMQDGDEKPLLELIKKVSDIIFPNGALPDWFHALGTQKRNALKALYREGEILKGMLVQPSGGVQDPKSWRSYLLSYIAEWGGKLRTLELAVQSIEKEDLEFQHGQFTIVPMPGVTKAMLKGALEALDAATDKLRSKFPNVLYGKVYLTTTLAKNVAAWYVSTEDKFYLNVKARKRFDNIYTIIHELGHRHDHKFLSAEGRKTFWELSTRKVREVLDFDDKLRDQVASEAVAMAKAKQAGDPIPKMSTELESYLKHMDAPDARKLTSAFLAGKIDDKELHRGIKGTKDLKVMTDRILHGPLSVTPYGATKPTENYAESFAHYVLGMNQPQELLEVISAEAR